MKKNKQKKKRDSSKIFGLVALGIFAMAMVLTVIGMSQTVSEIDKVAISHSPDVILANAGVADGKDVFLSVMYFDERSDECVNMYDMAQKEALEARQFEWSRCGYHNKTIEKGLVEYELGEDYLPVAKGGNLTPNRGLKDLTRWFDEVEGKSANYIGNLKLDYKADGECFR